MKSIMYHYVQNFKKKQKYLNFLSLSSFKKQVNFFEKKYNFFDTDELFYKKKFKKDAIFLTFDDGLKCHYKVAKDILYPKNIKGIFFIPALDYKKKNILSVHKIHFLLARFGPEKILNAIKNLGYHKYIDKKNLSKFGKIFYRTQVNKKNYIKVKKILNFYIIEKKRTQFITQLFYTFFSRKFEKKIFDEFYLSLDQVKQMSKMGMIIGGHSVTHTLMTKLSINKAKNEIQQSRIFLKKFTKKNFIFCYPYGGPLSYNNKIIKLLKKYKFDLSISVENRDITFKDLKTKYTLPRYNCNKFPYGKAFKNKFN